MNYKEKPKRKYHRNPDSARSKDDSTGKSSDKTRQDQQSNSNNSVEEIEEEDQLPKKVVPIRQDKKSKMEYKWLRQEPLTTENHANTKLALIRIMMTFYQVLGIFASIRARWNHRINVLARADESYTISHSDVLSFDCVYSHFGTDTTMKRIYMKTLLTDVLILFYVFIAGLVLLSLYKIKNWAISGGKSTLKISILLAFYCVYYNYQINLMRENIALFDCVNVYRQDKPIYHLRSELDIKCWEGNHLKWAFGLGFVMFMIWIIIIPSIFAIYLKKNKSKIQEKTIKARLGFFYAGLKPQFIHWEGVIFVAKLILIITVMVSGLNSATLQIYFALYVVITMLVMQLQRQPYENNRLNVTSYFSWFVLIIICLFGVYYSTIRYIKGVNELIAAIGIILIVLFILFWALQFFSSIRNFLQVAYIKRIRTPLRVYKRKNPFMSQVLELQSWVNYELEKKEVLKESKLDKLENNEDSQNSSILKGLVDSDKQVMDSSCNSQTKINSPKSEEIEVFTNSLSLQDNGGNKGEVWANEESSLNQNINVNIKRNLIANSPASEYQYPPLQNRYEREQQNDQVKLYNPYEQYMKYNIKTQYQQQVQQQILQGYTYQEQVQREVITAEQQQSVVTPVSQNNQVAPIQDEDCAITLRDSPSTTKDDQSENRLIITRQGNIPGVQEKSQNYQNKRKSSAQKSQSFQETNIQIQNQNNNAKMGAFNMENIDDSGDDPDVIDDDDDANYENIKETQREQGFKIN